jgi:hypothetical protein
MICTVFQLVLISISQVYGKKTRLKRFSAKAQVDSQTLAGYPHLPSVLLEIQETHLGPQKACRTRLLNLSVCLYIWSTNTS